MVCCDFNVIFVMYDHMYLLYIYISHFRFLKVSLLAVLFVKLWIWYIIFFLTHMRITLDCF